MEGTRRQLDAAMTLLTIYMPSKRSLAGSRDAIESALAYADHADARLIVSDNSGDMEKRRWLEGRSPRLEAIVSDAESAADNWRAAFGLVETPFLLPMGDDDIVSFRENEEPVDLSTLPADVIGVRPVTQIWTLADGVRQTERFPLIETTPGGRLFEYSRKARGNNSSYYSIFRTAPFLSLMRLFVDSHPTKGGYIDWAICLALFASGRVLHDPSLIYRYDLGRWAEADSLRQTKAKLSRMPDCPRIPRNSGGCCSFSISTCCWRACRSMRLRGRMPMSPATGCS